MTLSKLASIAEDGPWCGTRSHVGPPRPRPMAETMATGRHDSLGPHPEPWVVSHLLSAAERWNVVAGPLPDPWTVGYVEVGLYAAITMHQLAQRIGGDDAKQMTTAAERIFDETCGSIPISLLIWILLHRPPPPPPPWLQQVILTAGMLELTHGMPQGEAIVNAARKQLAQSLQELSGARTSASVDAPA